MHLKTWKPFWCVKIDINRSIDRHWRGKAWIPPWRKLCGLTCCTFSDRAVAALGQMTNVNRTLQFWWRDWNENSKLLTGKTFSSSLNGWLMVSYVEVSQLRLVTVDISPHISIREVISSDQLYFSTSLPTIFPKRKTAMLSGLDRMSCSYVGLKHPSPLCSCIGFSSIIGFPLMTHHSDFRLKDKTSDFYFYHVTGWNVWSNRFISIFSPRKR